MGRGTKTRLAGQTGRHAAHRGIGNSVPPVQRSGAPGTHQYRTAVCRCPDGGRCPSFPRLPGAVISGRKNCRSKERRFRKPPETGLPDRRPTSHRPCSHSRSPRNHALSHAAYSGDLTSPPRHICSATEYNEFILSLQENFNKISYINNHLIYMDILIDITVFFSPTSVPVFSWNGPAKLHLTVASIRWGEEVMRKIGF